MNVFLHQGESVVKEWAYSNLDTLIVTNQRLIHEYRMDRMNDSYIQKEEVKLGRYTRIESSISYGRVSIPMLVFGILFAVAGFIAKFKPSLVADLGLPAYLVTKYGIPLMLVGVSLIVIALLAEKRNAINLKVYEECPSPFNRIHDAQFFGISKITSITLKHAKVNRAAANELFNTIGNVLLVDKADVIDNVDNVDNVNKVDKEEEV